MEQFLNTTETFDLLNKHSNNRCYISWDLEMGGYLVKSRISSKHSFDQIITIGRITPQAFTELRIKEIIDVFSYDNSSFIVDSKAIKKHYVKYQLNKALS